ncbi:MAG: helix-turn-helix domain-containing protein [Thermoguttaceae bacterium]|jgi:excisionase family DNA binding protein
MTDVSTLAGAQPVPGRRLGDVQTVAAMLACSPRHVYRLADADRMPRPLRLGTLVRWDLDAIDRWIQAGCPAVRSARGGAKP